MNPKIIKTILAIIIILSMSYLGYFLKERYLESNQNKTEQKVLWTCPMHPQILQDKPGNCPICHMELVPIEEKVKQEEHQYSEIIHNPNSIQIKIDPYIVQKIGLRVQKAEKKQVERNISIFGHIDYDEREIYFINSRINGWIEKLYAKYNGKYIKKGEVLIAIYSPELYASQEEYLNLYKQYQLAKKLESSEILSEIYKTLKSSKERLKLWNISESQIQQIETQQKAQKLIHLTSPYNGFIIEKFVFEGQQVKEGMDLFKIANISNVWVIAHIPEKDIPFVYLGQKAKVEISQIPNKTFNGKITYVYPYIESSTRDLNIRIEIPNPNFEIKPGMYANIKLIYKVSKPILVVPYSSVIQTGTRNITFIHKGNGIIEPRIVSIGTTDGESWIEIKEGIKENEDVVVSSQFLLDSETRIQEAIQKLQSNPSIHQH